MESISQYAWLIPIFPLAGSLLIGIGLISFRRATNILRWRYSFLIIALLGISLILSCLILFSQINATPSYQWIFQWIVTNNFLLEIGYFVDPLTAVMLVIVTTVAILVLIYTDGYMSYDEGYVRFFAYLSLFTTSMLGLVLSPNLLQIYVFWELVGMCSYLLIGFWFTRPAAADACQKAFVTNRVGDFGLLLGILGFYWMTGSFEFDVISMKLLQLAEYDNFNTQLAIFFGFLIFLGPVAKSAQFPLHVWLPDAMEGPTPISALIHAATMVAAGVFLVARMFPIFSQFPFLMDLIAWTGAITAIIGATIAVTQVDLKKGLAYSTMSQLGYMIMAMGMGSYTASLFHLMTHAYSKALLFLSAGSTIHGMEPIVGFNPAKNQNMSLMGGIRKYMPITGNAFLIGTLSLCGIPPLACFWSKDAILSNAFVHSPLLWFIGWSTAGLTSFYMFRMYFLVFEGEFRGNSVNQEKIRSNKLPKESNTKMTLPLIILTLFSITIGWIGTPFNNQFMFLIHTINQEIEPFDINEFLFIAGSSVGIALLGCYTAYLIYMKDKNTDKFANFLQPFYQLSFNKWYIDDIYEYIFVKGNRQLAQQTLLFDKKIIDGFVNLTGLITLVSSESLRSIENGKIQSYILMIIFTLLTILGISQTYYSLIL